jgi:hypothetical protein
MSGPTRRKVKAKVLLAAAAGAAALTYASCGPIPSGNLMALPPCGPDGGPTPCYTATGGGAGGGGGHLDGG